jgi:hypothetical protein
MFVTKNSYNLHKVQTNIKYMYDLYINQKNKNVTIMSHHEELNHALLKITYFRLTILDVFP